MAFGPIIGGGSGGGGGGGLSVVTITGTTAAIDSSDATDLDVALPAGIDQFYVIGARIVRTAGASVLVGARLYPTAARNTGYSLVFGNQFGGVDIGGSPIAGPLDTTGGNESRAGIAMSSDGEFARCVIYNNDFAESGTFRLELDIIPIEGA